MGDSRALLGGAIAPGARHAVWSCTMENLTELERAVLELFRALTDRDRQHALRVLEALSLAAE